MISLPKEYNSRKGPPGAYHRGILSSAWCRGPLGLGGVLTLRGHPRALPLPPLGSNHPGSRRQSLHLVLGRPLLLLLYHGLPSVTSLVHIKYSSVNLATCSALPATYSFLRPLIYHPL